MNEEGAVVVAIVFIPPLIGAVIGKLLPVLRSLHGLLAIGMSLEALGLFAWFIAGSTHLEVMPTLTVAGPLLIAGELVLGMVIANDIKRTDANEDRDRAQRPPEPCVDKHIVDAAGFPTQRPKDAAQRRH